MQNDKRIEFNNTTNNIIDNNSDLKDFCDAIHKAGKSVLSAEEIEYFGCFNLSEDVLRPLFKKRNESLVRARNTRGTNDKLKSQYIYLKKDACDAVKIAKERWIMKIT